ncbi:DUF2785 domain-containing protein [Ectobacillus ponti]|uniref:DUF2785 domain-containing protein n=1 Tax=Ectobacillus ponti TaxID=2961894 RepID=A0AA41X2K4_9BACI|nr:DUF2785 domain-containing protein [Ectobacillus ponti]MCP8967552.1 DUF2785 domain-containing protein [Ectobacillus ponti]
MLGELREELLQIRDNEYTVPADTDAYPYAQLLLECLGSADAELRDKLAYTTLAKWILRGEFRHKELRGLLLQALSPNGLFFQIGEAGTDSVFKRAFSVLVVPLALRVHERDPFLSEEQLESTAEQVIEYIYLEQDVRGYVPGKGWAHSVAHTADALAALARTLPDGSLMPAMLDAILYAVSRDDLIYAHGEDERLASAVLALRQADALADDQWKAWLLEFAVLETDWFPERDYIILNRKLLLRSLYFRADEGFAALCLDGLQALQQLEHG